MQDGYLSISVINASNNRPIQNALVNVYGMNDQQESTGLVLENLKTVFQISLILSVGKSKNR
mgnify:CR=1 FL=1